MYSLNPESPEEMFPLFILLYTGLPTKDEPSERLIDVSTYLETIFTRVKQFWYLYKTRRNKKVSSPH